MSFTPAQGSAHSTSELHGWVVLRGEDLQPESLGFCHCKVGGAAWAALRSECIGSLRDVFKRGDRGKVIRNTKDLIFHFPWHTGVAESVIRSGKYKLRKDLDSLEIELFDINKDLEETENLAEDMPGLVQKLDKKRAKYLEEVNAETVTLTRRNYVELLEGGWVENGRKRLAKLKAELVADPSNKQKAFQVEISQNHVNFQDKQLERSQRLIRMHEERGTAEKN